MKAKDSEISRALQGGTLVRIHTGGEVAVVRVLACDSEELTCHVIWSSRPERYAYCDAVAFTIPLDAIDQVHPLGRNRTRPRR